MTIRHVLRRRVVAGGSVVVAAMLSVVAAGALAPLAVSASATPNRNARPAGQAPSGKAIFVANARTSSSAQWQVEDKVDFPLSAISCPTTADCWAVGGGRGMYIEATTDGGSTWQSQAVPVGTANLLGVSCPSVEDCWAVGEATFGAGLILATTDGGSTWVVDAHRTALVDAVTCPTTTDCWALSGTTTGAIVATDNAGASWHLQTNRTASLGSISCPDTDECVTVGGRGAFSVIGISTNGGTTWSWQAPPAKAVSELLSVSCGSASDCWIGGQGQNILATTDAGVTWSVEPIPSAVQDVYGLSCTTASDCTAAAYSNRGAILATTDGGISWTSQKVTSLADGPLLGVSCPASDQCWAVATADDEWYVISNS